MKEYHTMTPFMFRFLGIDAVGIDEVLGLTMHSILHACSRGTEMLCLQIALTVWKERSQRIAVGG
jgi:hypothetical protein